MAVAALAVAAIVNVLRASGDEEPLAGLAITTGRDTTTGAEPEPSGLEPLPGRLPLPGELREAGGVLWWSDVDCKAGALDLGSGSVSRLPAEHCRIWPAPNGDGVVVTATNRSDALDGRGLLAFSYRAGEAALEGPTVLEHPPGVIASELAWWADGGLVVACIATQEGTVVVATGVGSPGDALPDVGACFPAVLPDGRYAVVRGVARIELEGVPLLTDADVERLLPNVPRRARRTVSALAARDGEVVAGLVAVTRSRLLPSSGALAVVTADGEIRFSLHLRENVLPATVGLSPRGDALWYFDTGSGSANIVDVPGGRRLPPFDARWVAWAPDGRYVAAARDGSVAILTWPDGVEIERIPVAANVVHWTRAPGTR